MRSFVILLSGCVLTAAGCGGDGVTAPSPQIPVSSSQLPPQRNEKAGADGKVRLCVRAARRPSLPRAPHRDVMRRRAAASANRET